MLSTELTRVGLMLFGRAWKAQLADRMEVHPSQVSHWIAHPIELYPNIVQRLQVIFADRLSEMESIKSVIFEETYNDRYLTAREMIAFRKWQAKREARRAAFMMYAPQSASPIPEPVETGETVSWGDFKPAAQPMRFFEGLDDREPEPSQAQETAQEEYDRYRAGFAAMSAAELLALDGNRFEPRMWAAWEEEKDAREERGELVYVDNELIVANRKNKID